MRDQIRALCVYCGSTPGTDPRYRAAAVELGTLLGERRVRLVYGGGDVGLMGAVADAALAAGGQVTGIIPQALVDREIGHRGLTELRVVGSMHARKLAMADASDAFVALPGGIGTLEELIEVFTWTKLGLHDKPCAVLDVGGFYGRLIDFLDHTVREGFLSAEDRRTLLEVRDVQALLPALEAWGPVDAGQRIERDAV